MTETVRCTQATTPAGGGAAAVKLACFWSRGGHCMRENEEVKHGVLTLHPSQALTP